MYCCRYLSRLHSYLVEYLGKKIEPHKLSIATGKLPSKDVPRDPNLQGKRPPTPPVSSF